MSEFCSVSFHDILESFCQCAPGGRALRYITRLVPTCQPLDCDWQRTQLGGSCSLQLLKSHDVNPHWRLGHLPWLPPRCPSLPLAPCWCGGGSEEPPSIALETHMRMLHLNTWRGTPALSFLSSGGVPTKILPQKDTPANFLYYFHKEMKIIQINYTYCVCCKTNAQYFIHRHKASQRVGHLSFLWHCRYRL